MNNDFTCHHCGKPQKSDGPESFRRILILLVGTGLFAITVQGLFDLYYVIQIFTSLTNVMIIGVGMWGLSYMVYLWLSFFCIGYLKLPGCEFVALKHVFLGKPIHKCVDSVLNSVLDKAQKEKGLSIELLKTESAQKWIMGIILLGVFLAFILNSFTPTLNLLMYGIFSTVYLLYDLVLHRYSIDRNDLAGTGDYTKLLREIFRMTKKSTND